MQSVRPTLIWAQRKDRILLTIDVVDITDEKITLDEKTFAFSGVGRNNSRYDCNFELREEVIPQESKQSKTARAVFLSIKKKEAGPYWPTLAKTKLPYLKVDFNKWKEEDESDEEEDPNEDGLQNLMQKMDMGGGMGMPGMGMPGMGMPGMGMPGMGMPGMGMPGMGGPPGMGMGMPGMGMGGPPGMPGVNGTGFDPGNASDSDSDDEPIPGLS